MNKSILLTMGLLMMAATGIATAGDAAAGKAKSSSCVSCHGMNGVAMMSGTPHIAGQNKAYLVNSIKAYKDGKRDHVMMKSMVMGLSDADIDNLATYYSGLKP